MKGKGGGMRCPVVHFNLLIRGSKGGLVGHNLVQSDCPAKGDKGKACNVPQKKGGSFVFKFVPFLEQCIICLHESRSNKFMLEQWHCQMYTILCIFPPLIPETWRETFSCIWKRIFDGLWTLTAIKKNLQRRFRNPTTTTTTAPPPNSLKSFITNPALK